MTMTKADMVKIICEKKRVWDKRIHGNRGTGIRYHERDPGRRREDQDFWVWEFQRTHQASPQGSEPQDW